MEASAPTGPYIEPEPRDWQPRAMWVGARLLCGAIAFFFMAFVFAYFYLRSLNVHHGWKIGSVHPSIGLGVAIVAVLIASAALLRFAATQPRRTVSTGLVRAGAGARSRSRSRSSSGSRSASAARAAATPACSSAGRCSTRCSHWARLYWIETQVAAAWRARREGPGRAGAQMMAAEIEACSFVWTFYVAIGVLAFVILYLI